MDAHPILDGSLKDIDVYDCEVSELDAIARNTGLADRAAIGARQVGLQLGGERTASARSPFG
jgi:hypothetical protein